MPRRQDLVRESLELEAMLLEDLGETDEAEKVRARIPKSDAELESPPRRESTPGRETKRPMGRRVGTVRASGSGDYVLIDPSGHHFAVEVKKRRWTGKRMRDAVESSLRPETGITGDDGLDFDIPGSLRLRWEKDTPEG